MIEPQSGNLLAWMAQTILVASGGALLPVVFRLRHPRTQLAYCHVVLAICMLLPFLEPWRHPSAALPAEVGTSGTAAADTPATATGAAAILERGRRLVRAPGTPAAPEPRRSISTVLRDPALIWWILIAGAAARLIWLLGGLWQIRRYRIAAMPLYPVPESVTAASAITHADAVFCISSDTPGPVMLGWLNPVVLLPESFQALGEEAQCGVVCHELLHVRRHDWLVTLIEELAGAVLWFNPGVWLLLAETRLAREQLVDAETVRLTGLSQPYIEALLAIARGRPVLDLAPAPLFLRRRHLTQRMHALLNEVSMSKLRLFSSYGSIAALFALTCWYGAGAFPLVGRPAANHAQQPTMRPYLTEVPPLPGSVERPASQALPAPSPTGPREPALMAFQSPRREMIQRFGEPRSAAAPIPADSHEPVTGPVRIPATPDERAAALSLLERASQNSKLHMPGTPPFRLDATFSAGGNAAYTGSGELTETWMSGRSWRWTANLGNFSVVRVGSNGIIAEDKHVPAIPMRVHMLRNAIFWAAQFSPSSAQIRTAVVQWSGRPATCLLISGMVAPAVTGRLWEEEEYCVDNASGLLMVHSIAPGEFVVYSYNTTPFHERYHPNHITVYVAGSMVLDAQVTFTDPGQVDESLLRPTSEMLANGPVTTTELAVRFPMNVPGAALSGVVKPVIVHASIDGEGNVVEAELSSAADPALGEPALDLVKKNRFPASRTQRQAYVNVRFVPASQ